MQFPVLFSPTARVYNLRFLLVVTVANLIYFVIVLVSLRPQFEFQYDSGVALWIVSCAVIIEHQVIGVFTWRIRGLAAIDLAMLTIEIGAVGYLVYWTGWWPFGLPITQLLALMVSALFRCGTILKSKDKFFHQQFYFLGGCTPVHPPYEALSILLNRSLSRPLVRSMILSCVVLGATAFAIYTILIIPLVISQPYLKNMNDFTGIDPQLNATITLTHSLGSLLTYF
ncbi:hypothetical protein B0H13DRAFT_1885332 [Mycena leptocephala]|nr:hypothetical protein B0H13DRAFT_1885332 [Mycena leptocephala]